MVELVGTDINIVKIDQLNFGPQPPPDGLTLPRNVPL